MRQGVTPLLYIHPTSDGRHRLKPALLWDTDYMVEKTYQLAPYVGTFGALLKDPQGYTEESARLYWRFRRAILEDPQGYTGGSAGLYWRICLAILENMQVYTGESAGLYWRICRDILEDP